MSTSPIVQLWFITTFILLLTSYDNQIYLKFCVGYCCRKNPWNLFWRLVERCFSSEDIKRLSSAADAMVSDVICSVLTYLYYTVFGIIASLVWDSTLFYQSSYPALKNSPEGWPVIRISSLVDEKSGFISSCYRYVSREWLAAESEIQQIMNSLVDRYFLSDVNDVYYSPQWKFNITIGLLSTAALLYFIHMPLRLSCIYIIKNR